MLIVGTKAELSEEAAKAAKDTNEETLQIQENALQNGEKIEFQAEISQLMNILISYLYTNKDIFLRELISNASDALDKIRHLALTNREAFDTKPEYKIYIKSDDITNTITIRDTGVGMTKNDLINSLGTIAKSGTKEFIEQLAEGTSDNNLIGQFGVGFYSAFLVAETVTVTTKHNEDEQYIWSSDGSAESSFTIVKDPRGNTLGRGTEIILHLKEGDDIVGYLKTETLEKLIRKYSEFVHFDIMLWETHNVTRTIEVEPEEKKDEETTNDETNDENVEVTEEKKVETKEISEEVSEWKLINNEAPIWTKNPKKVSDNEYDRFFKAISKKYVDPAKKPEEQKYLDKIHFKAEGNIEFQSILYIADRPTYDMYDPNKNDGGIALYVKRVFITDSIPDFMPRYLSFLRGVVDSDDLPLHVSRELLQESTVLKVIKKKLVSKAISMIRRLAKDDQTKRKEREEEKAAREADPDYEEDKELAETPEEEEFNYIRFWRLYGKQIRLGIMEDPVNRPRLVKLLRYKSTKSEFYFTSFEEYVKRMPDNQEYIYFIAEENIDKCRMSPFLEELRKRNFEVLYLTDAIDEYMIQQIPSFEGKDLMSVTRDDLKFGDEDMKDIREKQDELNKEFLPLTHFFKENLGDQIQKAQISTRLSSSPCVLVAPKYGISANMARIMKAQALGANMNEVNKMMLKQRILELNPNHVVIRELLRLVASNKNDPTAKSVAHLLLETAMMRSGYVIENTALFSSRIYNMIEQSMNIRDEDEDEDFEDEEIVEEEEPVQAPADPDDAPETEAHEDL
eukprot:CAMPEP_0117421634 /NCGR_PEP_ID=MMETSP0758-20121206/2662_1 /TAXON_ID=63605 /ORGANISM="Percolomonas cosmopolitus, Strain AE-1 (ATCC 50343)" /LENGTH=794 /DNA_ID=CAMNT_0005203827 /DNA_START=70 /DNA_END=2454 /DNA_ORIENTATION=-